MPTVNNVARSIVSSGVSEIPEAGAVIGALVDALWPESKEDVWGEIKSEAEVFFNQKLSTLVHDQVTGKLNGLHRVVADYNEALRDSQGNTSYITEKYNVALGQFEVLQDDFGTPGYELVLLPLFAQMVNLHLALLRDGVLNGARWAWTPKIVADLTTQLETVSAGYVAWADKWYRAGYDQLPEIPKYQGKDGPLWNLLPDEPTEHLSSRQWNVRNRYIREMTLKVTDFAHYWPYFSPSKGLAPKLTREIYSDLQGTADWNPKINPDSSVKGRITWINIWAWDWPYGIQVSYLSPSEQPGEWKPQIGGSGGAIGPAPHGCSEEIHAVNPVVKAIGRSGNLVNELGFAFRDGRAVRCGGYQGGNAFSSEFDGHILSQIYSTGPSGVGSILECVIFGFRLEDSYSDGDARFYALTGLAQAAFEVGELAKAADYASELLVAATAYQTNWNYGNAIFYGNMVVGRVALRRGDVSLAKNSLLASAQTPGSPQLNSFGPNMSLAKDLLTQGERGAVLEFFTLCRTFWESQLPKLDEWTATVKGGGIPDFGANLAY